MLEIQPSLKKANIFTFRTLIFPLCQAVLLKLVAQMRGEENRSDPGQPLALHNGFRMRVEDPEVDANPAHRQGWSRMRTTSCRLRRAGEVLHLWLCGAGTEMGRQPGNGRSQICCPATWSPLPCPVLNQAQEQSLNFTMLPMQVADLPSSVMGCCFYFPFIGESELLPMVTMAIKLLQGLRFTYRPHDRQQA